MEGRREETQTETGRGSSWTARAWIGTVAAVVLLILLLVFILQNTASVKVNFFGAHGHMSLGVALLAAAVAGGLIVLIIGAARIATLRLRARRAERAAKRTAAA